MGGRHSRRRRAAGFEFDAAAHRLILQARRSPHSCSIGWQINRGCHLFYVWTKQCYRGHGIILGHLRLSSCSCAKLGEYVSRHALVPSLSLSVLHFTVLSLAGRMATLLLAIGYTSTSLALVRMLATGCEMLLTWLAPRVMRLIDPVRNGMWLISVQSLFLGISVILFWKLESTPFLAATCLVAGTALSRIGLWGFDLSAQIIIQQEISPEQRGTFSMT